MSYVEDQEEWIRNVDLKNGDRLLVIASFESRLGITDTVPAGTIVIADDLHHPHDEMGLSIYLTEEDYKLRNSTDVFGMAFYCLAKLK